MMLPLLVLAAAVPIACGGSSTASAPAMRDLPALTGRVVDNADLLRAIILPRFCDHDMADGILMGSAAIIREIGAPGATP
ncbi:hypothetical protein [Sphingomonas koreensis]